MIAGVNLWLTYDCNLRCKYCYEQKLKRSCTNEINKVNINEYISYIEKYLYEKEIGEDNFYIVNFHGGEPLIKFEILKDAVKKLKESSVRKNKKISFGVTTNGTLLNDEIINFLCENFQYSLSVSIDGNKEIHDQNRKFANGKGSFDLVINNALKVLQKRKDVRIRMTFNTKSVNSLCDNILYLIELGFKTIVPVADFFDSNWNDSNSKIIGEQLDRLMNSDVYKENPNVKVGILKSLESLKPKGTCSAGESFINISADGRIFPCTYTVGQHEFNIGNIHDGIDFEKVKMYKEICTSQNEECRGCTYYNYCRSGRCKFVNKIITGSFLTPCSQICALSNEEFKIWSNLHNS